MEHMMQIIPQETAELLRENNVLRQRARALEARVAALETENQSKDAATRARIREHMQGYAARARHKELREDIAEAMVAAVKLLAVAETINIVWALVWRIVLR